MSVTWTVVASLPFAPEVVLPTLQRFKELHVGATGRYGFESTFNPTYPSVDGQQPGWVFPWFYGIDQGALALMIENYRTRIFLRLCQSMFRVVTWSGSEKS